MAATKRSTAKRVNSPKRLGQAIAIGLLRELECVDPKDQQGRGDDCVIDARYRRKGMRQDNVLLAYLRALRERHDPAVEAGFCSLLSDFVGITTGGCVPDSDYYVKLLKLQPRRFTAVAARS
jgi:hypothetical protein